MNVLSLFDGMSCGRIALQEIGITPSIYYASEIDRHAIAQTQLNFPDTVQLGSVTDVDVNKLEPIDLLIGGSPCQSFSFAGKRNGMTTTEHEEVCTLERYLELKEQGFEFEGQSYLFWEYMRILTDIRRYNPNVLFLLENVEMGKKWEAVLSHAIGMYGVHINSALVSAQNRKRIYWTNIRTRTDGLFGEIYTDIPQPKDRFLFLKDIIEPEVDEKYYLSDRVVAKLIKHRERNEENGNGFGAVFHEPNEKMGALKVGGKNIDDLITIYQRPRGFNSGVEYIDKSPTLSANSWEQNNILFISSNQRQASVSENKSTPLVAAGGMGGGHVPMIISGTLRSFGGLRFREIHSGKGATLLARARKDCSSQNACIIDKRIRRLTPTECARLQTIPEWYKWKCSETQQYKMLGNGWTIEVIKHIFSFMKKSNNMEKKKIYVLMLSEVFPKAHGKAGMPTNFKVKFAVGQGCPDCDKPQDLSGVNISDCNGCVNACSIPKLHTIRANYPLWERRIKKIQNEHAVLSIRQWSGKPYRSKQVEIARLTADNGIGIQKLSFDKDKDGVPSLKYFDIDGKYIDMNILANNDGLSKEDWQEWFRGYDLSKPMAIIHFTKFRY